MTPTRLIAWIAEPFGVGEVHSIGQLVHIVAVAIILSIVIGVPIGLLIGFTVVIN